MKFISSLKDQHIGVTMNGSQEQPKAICYWFVHCGWEKANLDCNNYSKLDPDVRCKEKTEEYLLFWPGTNKYKVCHNN